MAHVGYQDLRVLLIWPGDPCLLDMPVADDVLQINRANLNPYIQAVELQENMDLEGACFLLLLLNELVFFYI